MRNTLLQTVAHLSSACIVLDLKVSKLYEVRCLILEANSPSSREDYNILADRHLAHFFNSPRVKQHLIKTGLITPSGVIVPEKDFRSDLIRKSRQEAALDACIQALTDEVIDSERNRQLKAREEIEDILNSQRIRKIRAERRQKREREVLRTILFDIEGLVDLETEEERILHNAGLLLFPPDGAVNSSNSPRRQSEKNGHPIRQKRG